jgi:hypothetical protein
MASHPEWEAAVFSEAQASRATELSAKKSDGFIVITHA